MDTRRISIAVVLTLLTLTTVSNAQRGRQFSKWSAPVNIGSRINTDFDDNVPVVSKDEKTLFFTSNRMPGGYGDEDIWVSKRPNKKAPWGEPVNLGPGVNTPYRDRIRSLSEDGRIILFQSDRPNGSHGGPDIWTTVRKRTNDDFGWSTPMNLGSVINTESNEVAAKYLFNDRYRNGNLFFSSGRLGGFGGPDIYESEITENGFSSPINVFELNTPSIETCFWVRDDGLEIIFSSNRPSIDGDMSKLDLWVSTRSSVYETWSPPEGLGPMVNTEGYLDVNPMLASDDTVLYFASSRPNRHGLTGNMDIFMSTRTRLQ